MAKNNNLTDFLRDIADAIREKEGSSDLINPQEFSDRIRALVLDKPTELGLTLVEYIESTGNQWIDTGFVPNQDTKVYAVLSVPVSNDTNWAFGSRLGEGSQMYAFAASSNGAYYSPYQNDNCALSASYNSADFFVLDKDKNRTYINGKLAYEAAYMDFSAAVPMQLFAGNTAGTKTGGRIRIFTLEIYDNGKLVRDYIAGKNKDGVYGMYDLVNKTFHPSEGTASFVGGESIPDIEEFMAADGEFEAADGKYYVKQ